LFARGLLVVVLAGLVGVVTAGDPSPPDGGAAGGAPSEDAIRSAVGRGVAWLRREQAGDGSFGTSAGETALALFALRHSGVPATDDACASAARRLARVLPDGTVYGAALGTLALLSQDRVAHRDEVAGLVRHLARGQCRNGQWTYAYRATARKSGGDNSNTQLAALALAVARLHGIEVADADGALAHCTAHFEQSQNEDGGFGYAPNQRRRSYGSMTAGGAMAMALGRAAATGVRFADPALADAPPVARALAWLAAEFDPAANRGAADAFGSRKGKRSDAFWRHYWLWSLERACAAAGVEKLGQHDWYGEGARFLVSTQGDDGSWRDPERELQATCFALLFLQRSTRAVLTPPERERGPVSGTPGIDRKSD